MLPKRVTLELTNRCNRNCRGCPRRKMTYPLGDMQLDLLEKIVAQLPSSTTIVPFFRGEAAFHPHFVEALKTLKRFSAVQMATNGDFLTASKQNAILRTCSFISYSLHKPSLPADLPVVAQFLDEAQSRGISTQVSILETEVSGDFKQKLVERWLQHASRFRIYVEHSSEGFGNVKPKYRRILEDKPCKMPFTDMVVYWDGKIALCCYDWDNPAPLGDLTHQTVEEVWQGEKYRKVRELHQTGRRKQVSACKDCDYWMTAYLPNKMFGELFTT